MNTNSKLNTILLIIVIILLAVGIWAILSKKKSVENIDYNFPTSADLVTKGNSLIQENKNEVNIQSQEQKKLVYSDKKFNVQFSYNSKYGILQLGQLDFGIDAIGNGHEYRCPLSNNSARVYSEKEVRDTNVDTTNCTYTEPNLDSAAQGQLTAKWTHDIYGGIPTIHNIEVSGRPARLIYGTTDIRTLIISLPKPYIENGYTYDFLSVTINKPLIDDIITTFKFN